MNSEGRIYTDGIRVAFDGHRLMRVYSGKGQNRTLRSLNLLPALWPPVFAGEQDMGQELGLGRQPGVFPLFDCFAEMGGIPGNDDGGEQVKSGHAAVLPSLVRSRISS